MSEPAQEPEPGAVDPAPDTVLLRVHRAPRFGRFVVTGGVAGVLLGVIATLVTNNGTNVGRLLFALCLVTGLVGGLAGGALALAADRRRGAGAP